MVIQTPLRYPNLIVYLKFDFRDVSELWDPSKLISYAGFSFLSFACPPFHFLDLNAEVNKLTAKWEELYKVKDVKGLLETYTEDLKNMEPGEPVIHGREGNFHEMILFIDFGQFQL